jgi:hypothetical protein
MTKHESVFEEIYYLLVDSREKDYFYSCKIISAIFAVFIVGKTSKCFIIDSQNHSVVFDGTNTWDLSLGIVFENYKYPDLDIPEPIFIPKFKDWYVEETFKLFYNENILREAKQNLTIKEVKKLGVINGTKEN